MPRAAYSSFHLIHSCSQFAMAGSLEQPTLSLSTSQLTKPQGLPSNRKYLLARSSFSTNVSRTAWQE